MGRDESHSDLAASQAHGEVGDSASFGEKFGLTDKGETGIVHLFFGNRSRDDRLNFSPSCQRNRLLQRENRMLRRSTPRSSRSKRVCRANDLVIELAGKLAAFQGGMDDFRSDTGWIAGGDPNLHTL